MSATAVLAPADLSAYALRLGDDALVLAQRLGEWYARAPELEEDLALTNVALDLLGQARALLSYAGEVEGRGRDEDDLAYLRDAPAFANALLVEQPNGDFAHTIVRQLLFSAYQQALYARLADSRDETLAGIAEKAVKEVAYHRDHAVRWTLRLGDGTAESHARAQAALDALWPYGKELLASDALAARAAAAGVGVDPATLRDAVLADLDAVLREATLTPPPRDRGPAPHGGREGRHGEALVALLATMQELHRAHPGARW